MVDVLVIGGGAAGFYGAIHIAEKNPKLKILILEKSTKLLSKVSISGGGRCNVTHHEFQPKALAAHYPRGEKHLRVMFQRHQVKDVIGWFTDHGVQLKSEEDGRMFPVTDSSQTIIDCFLHSAHQLGISIATRAEVIKVEKQADHFNVFTREGNQYSGRRVMVCIGGHSQAGAYRWLADLGHTIVTPIPSLFTFNDPSGRFKHLMGIAVPDATVKIAGTKFSSHGPVLITHWGLSGPAVIRLSAWAAQWLAENHYTFTALVNWLGDMAEEQLRATLLERKSGRVKMKIATNPQFGLPARLWQTLCHEAEIEETRTWGEISLKQLNRLLEQLIRCPFSIRGKTTFKEEFVTCGGVDLSTVNTETMESTIISNLYFAGEVLNIDGETGGFNFQAAWTTAWVAAQALAKANG